MSERTIRLGLLFFLRRRSRIVKRIRRLVKLKIRRKLRKSGYRSQHKQELIDWEVKRVFYKKLLRGFEILVPSY